MKAARYFCCVTLLAVLAATTNPMSIRLQNPVLKHVYLSTTRPGFTDAGYLTGFVHDDSQANYRFTAAAGIYDLSLRYCSPGGIKLCPVSVNGLSHYIKLHPTGESFENFPAGKIELVDGESTLAINRGWGYFDIDSVTIAPAGPIAAPAKIAANPVDPDATPAARALLKQLADDYGRRTLSGVYSEADDQHVRQITGKTPAIFGDDLMEFSPTRASRNHVSTAGLPARWISHAKGGQTLTLSWHWNAPAGLIDAIVTDKHGHQTDCRWYKGFNANATTFDIEAALKDPAGRALLLRDIDAIAAPLKKLSDANIPVLWRPLHEAENRWFWWGCKGPGPFKSLWQLLYDRLMNYHHLHNLIWVYTTDGDPAWYPGDSMVDIVGLDFYPDDLRDPVSEKWERLKSQFDGRKMLALTEFGGVPDLDRMHRLGVDWAYFVSWSGKEGLLKNTDAEINTRYHSARAGN